MAVAPAALAEALRDRYTFERELGRGGMAVVFLARDLRHERPVALKVLNAELLAVLAAERFQREIRVAARLQHPHIVTVLDSGEAAGRLWFTMPFVDGESLRDRLHRDGPLPLDEAIRIAREVADGLEYAHRQGVIHRDIKPENILLSGGHALIADFGIARALGAESAPTDGPAAGQLTRTGLIIGTPAYMSPEQASGEPALDARTDLYSLAVVLYEMLAGAPPFTGPTAQAVMAKHFSGEVPSLREARPAVPEGIETAIRKALAPAQDDRFATAGELAEALERGRLAPPTVLPAGGTSGARTSSAGGRSVLAARLAVALGLLVALGAAVGWWLAHRKAADEVAPRRLAVLPFENVGAAEDEYFADGVADAVRGKLSALPGVQIIASSSSDQYKNTTKSPQEIGRELGAQYLLVGKVRWQKGGGANRVQVSPELIQTASATTRWQQPFDAPLEDVFRVQVDIANRVADALDLALGAGAQEQMTERPTRNLAAYDAFLRGERLSHRVGVTDVSALQQAVPAYEEAVALDSSFALAWAQLSRAHSTIYVNSARPLEDAERARSAAERAIALGPGVPQAYFAKALYLSAIRLEHARALEEVARGRRLAPGDAELLSMAGLAEQQLGRWEAAVAHFREAQSLDPRSLATARRLGRVLLWLRRYPEAREACDYALRLSSASPDVLDMKLMTFLGQGDLAGARAALRDAAPEPEPTRRIAHLARFFYLFWMLEDEDQRLLLRLTPGAFDDDRGAWGLTLARTHALRGDTAAARVYADSARIALQRQVVANPRDAFVRANLGVALAMSGRRADAVREGEQALKLEPIATNGITGPLAQFSLVHTYVILGDQDAALARLEPLLRIPFYVSPAWLRIDPTFTPLRNHPRFRELMTGK
ncbi:MAG: protein kinase domain-containing protein [Gemmatimonadales bacterium]